MTPKVVDIAPGSKPKLPKTWPGLPILIDSPGWSPNLKGKTVEVRVPFDDIGVVNVFKVASGELSLPGKINP